MNRGQIDGLLKARGIQGPLTGTWGSPSRSRFKRLLYSSLGVLLVLLIIGVFNRDGFLEVLELQKEAGDYRSNIFRLQQDNTRLMQEIISLRNDPSHIEKIAREELGLAFPGETVFVFPDS